MLGGTGIGAGRSVVSGPEVHQLTTELTSVATEASGGMLRWTLSQFNSATTCSLRSFWATSMEVRALNRWPSTSDQAHSLVSKLHSISLPSIGALGAPLLFSAGGSGGAVSGVILGRGDTPASCPPSTLPDYETRECSGTRTILGVGLLPSSAPGM